MMRYVTPLLFAAVTAYMWYYNGANDSSKLVLPLIDVIFPAAAGDPVLLAARSFQAAVGLTLLVTASAIVEHIRAIRRDRQLEAVEAQADDG